MHCLQYGQDGLFHQVLLSIDLTRCFLSFLYMATLSAAALKTLYKVVCVRAAALEPERTGAADELSSDSIALGEEEDRIKCYKHNVYLPQKAIKQSIK